MCVTLDIRSAPKNALKAIMAQLHNDYTHSYHVVLLMLSRNYGSRILHYAVQKSALATHSQ